MPVNVPAPEVELLVKICYYEYMNFEQEITKLKQEVGTFQHTHLNEAHQRTDKTITEIFDDLKEMREDFAALQTDMIGLNRYDKLVQKALDDIREEIRCLNNEFIKSITPAAPHDVPKPSLKEWIIKLLKK